MPGGGKRHAPKYMTTACDTCQQQAWSLSPAAAGLGVQHVSVDSHHLPPQGCPAHAITQPTSRSPVQPEEVGTRSRHSAVCRISPAGLAPRAPDHRNSARIQPWIQPRSPRINQAQPLHVANMPTDARGLAHLSRHPEVGAKTSPAPSPPPKSPRACSAALWLCQPAQATKCSPMPRVNPAEPVVSLVRPTAAHTQHTQ